MPINISRNDAEQIIQNLFETQVDIQNSDTDLIFSILTAEHKTYKYILITALLAKSTNNSVNPLALQAGAPLDGAYDARSLCHKVVVPFERDFLNNALGGSNEPFLNKPARFTHLSESNAVRRGTDLEILKNLITVLSHTISSDTAKKYLCFALEILRIKSLTLIECSAHKTYKIDAELIMIYKFIVSFISKSYEGETCVIIVGALEKVYHNQFNKNFKVIVHKVNQSGASSREIGDIDIYHDKQYKYSIEVKDKDFTEYDVAHAFEKIIAAEGEKGAFIYSPKAKYDEVRILQQLELFNSKHFFTLFKSILSYSRTILFNLNDLEFHNFINVVFEVCKEINCRTQTKNWLNEVLTNIQNKTI